MNTNKSSKLSFRRETLMPLTTDEVAGVHGGTAITVTSSQWCIGATVAATQSSDKCAQAAGESLAKGNDFVKKKLGFSF